MGRAATLPVLGPVAVLALFAGACVLPAGYYRGKFLEEGVPVEGLGALLFGWSVFLLGRAEGLGWFANVLLAAGLVRQWQGRYAAAARWAGMAAALGLWPLAVLLAGWSVDVRRWPDPALTFTLGSGDDAYAWAELRVGYFVWLTAHGLLFGLAVVCCRRYPGAEAAVAEPVGAPDRGGGK